MKSIFSPTYFINIFCINLRNCPFSTIKGEGTRHIKGEGTQRWEGEAQLYSDNITVLPLPIISVIEQYNFPNESLHVMGQQPDHIENTVSIKKSAFEKSVFEKIEKPLLDLSSQ